MAVLLWYQCGIHGGVAAKEKKFKEIANYNKPHKKGYLYEKM